MLDIKFIRANPDQVTTAANEKNLPIDVPALIALDDQRRTLQQAADTIRSQQHQANQAVAQADGQEKKAKISELKATAEKLHELEQQSKTIEEQYNQAMLSVPNIPDQRVPRGSGPADNKELKRVGALPKFDFEAKDHLTLGRELDLIDIARGVKVSGSRSYYLKGWGARLENALMTFGLDWLRQRGFTQFATPLLADAKWFYGTGYFPWMANETFTAVARDRQQHLIGSSEVTLCALHGDEILTDTELPKRYTAWTPCFRTEVGSYGKDTHGLFRVRQFNKIEQVVICPDDDDLAMQLFEELITNAEDFLTALELPYRVMELCTGEMGAGQKYKRDIETWMPSRQSYGETHSCSWLGTFQARRLGLRYRAAGKIHYCQTLNNTLAASPRLLIPLLEINQQADGSIKIPLVLQPYLGGATSIRVDNA